MNLSLEDKIVLLIIEKYNNKKILDLYHIILLLCSEYKWFSIDLERGNSGPRSSKIDKILSKLERFGYIEKDLDYHKYKLSYDVTEDIPLDNKYMHMEETDLIYYVWNYFDLYSYEIGDALCL